MKIVKFSNGKYGVKKYNTCKYQDEFLDGKFQGGSVNLWWTIDSQYIEDCFYDTEEEAREALCWEKKEHPIHLAYEEID